MPCSFLIVNQPDFLIRTVHITSYTEWQAVLIQIRWLARKGRAYPCSAVPGLMLLTVTCKAWSSTSPCLSLGNVLKRLSGSIVSLAVFFCCLPTMPIRPGNGKRLSCGENGPRFWSGQTVKDSEIIYEWAIASDKREYSKCPKMLNTLFCTFFLKSCTLSSFILKYLVEWQIVQTLIRMLLREQSDLGLHCLHVPFCQQLWFTKF